MDKYISFNQFTFQYDAQAEATLKDISFDIVKGEKVLILGPSGSGKSTLAQCLNGIIPNTVVPAASITALILLALESIIALNGSLFKV